ncbi:MAG TPA: TIGR02594 family protein, partial [Xanthobacteraceae bacterium]|nr:TIGR02594 family protein [Xanthobacteraceae bacterium]
MLPSRYAWLARESGPKMLVEALKLYGTMETPGSANNPTIVAWAWEVGGEVADVFKADGIPWCGLFMAVVAKRAGK